MPVDTNVTEGESFSINCTYPNADRIFWRKGGAEITSDSNFNIESADSSTSTLILSPQANHVTHTGEYDCVAVVDSNQFNESFTITVQCKFVFE